MQIDNVMIRLQPQSITTDVLLEKYAKGNETTAEEIYKRVARHLSSVEKPESREMYETMFYNNMVDGGIGAGRIMSSAGTDLKATLINCFVVAVGDCIDGYDEEGVPGIYEALRQAACTMQKGGGVGYNFSNIRPKGSLVKSVDSSASGPCSYIDIFDASCRTIESAGCFAGDTLINTTDGLIPIKEIVESDKEFYAITHLGPKKVTAKFKNGVKPILMLVTKYGYTVKVTEDHKFAQLENGKIVTHPLKDIIKSDNRDLLISVPLAESLEPKHDEEEMFAYITGAFHGNGTWIYDKALGDPDRKIKGMGFSNNITKTSTIEGIYCRMAGLGFKGNIRKVANENTILLDYYDRDYFYKLEEYGITKGDMSIPPFILSGSKEVRAAYLAGLFDTDGNFNNSKSNIRLRMISKKLLSQCQVVLASLGVMTTLKLEREATGNWKRIFCLGIYGAYAQDAFLRSVGRFTSQWLNEIATRDRVGFSHPWAQVKEFGYQAKQFRKIWPGNVVKNPNISMNALINSGVTTPELVNTVTDGGWFIKELPPEETYDLEVEDVHLVSGNGVYTSNSRRGAQLSALNISHPDVLEFVKAKRTKGRWNNFNVSVLVTDEFMAKKEKGEMFRLTHKATPSDDQIKAGVYFDDAEKVWVYSEISTTELWDEIMRSNYDYAEPGILFYDNINNNNNLHYVEKIEATNPCVTGNTTLITPKGYVTIESRVDRETVVWNGFQWSVVTPRVTGTDQEILDMVFSDGTTLSCTPYHKFILANGSRVEAKDLTDRHVLAKHAFPIVEGKYKIASDSPCATDCNVVPDDIVKVKSRVKWLQRLDGYKCTVVVGGVTVTGLDDNTKEETLKDIKRMLAVTGCLSYVMNPSGVPYLFIPNSSLYTLKLLGLKWKGMKALDLGKPCDYMDGNVTPVSATKRKKLEPKVYCFTDPLNNSGVFNGIMTGNCGEVPLPPNGCCDLGPIILPKLVTNPFTTYAKFDYVKLEEMVKIQVRMLDNVLDATVWPLEEQRLEAMSKRRIGVGFTGLANAIAMCRKTYYTREGLDMAERISTVMRDAAYTASAMIAKEKGSFPLYDSKEFFKVGTSASRLPDKVKALIIKYGIRNSHLLSIAPTGTVSLAFADNASNGIEPPFSFAYTRKKRVGDGHVNYNVLDHSFRVYLNYLTELTGNDINSKALEEAVCSYQDTVIYAGDTVKVKDVLPASMVTALDMTPDQHLAMMRVVQPFICQSISKTVNVPKECSFDDFKSIYDKAWLYGLKGVSTYKPNDILGSVLSVEKPVEVAKVVSEEKPVVDVEATAVTLEGLTAQLYSQKFESRTDGLLTGISTKGRFHTEQGEQKFILTINFVELQSPLADGGVLKVKRPVEFLLTSNFTSSSSVWQAAMRFISLMARSGVPIPKILENMREITWEHGKVRYGTRVKEGKTIPRWHNSDVAAIGYVIQEALEQTGCLDSEGKVTSVVPNYPTEFEFTSKPAMGKAPETLVTPRPKETKREKTGRICPECGSTAMVKRDGCEVCEDCNYMGTCG